MCTTKAQEVKMWTNKFALQDTFNKKYAKKSEQKVTNKCTTSYEKYTKSAQQVMICFKMC